MRPLGPPLLASVCRSQTAAYEILEVAAARRHPESDGGHTEKLPA